MADNVSLQRNALCSVHDVKAIDPKLSSAPDGEIALLINHFSSLAEGQGYSNRSFEKKTYTEDYNGYCKSSRILLKAPPIRTLASLEVWDDPTRLFDNDDADLYRLALHTDYIVIDGGGKIGLCGIQLVGRRFRQESMNVRIIYPGGISLMVEDDDVVDIPSPLRSACIQQVRFWWMNKENLGVQSISSMGGSTRFADSGFIEVVQMTLRDWRRHD